MKIAYFKTDTGYIAVTDESPKGFKDVLYVGKGGSINKIEEQVFEISQLRKLTKVNLKDVPDAWLLALGYDHPPMPKPEPKPAPVEEFPLLDADGENLVAYVPIRRRQLAVVVQPDRTLYDAGLIIGLVIGIILIACGCI